HMARPPSRSARGKRFPVGQYEPRRVFPCAPHCGASAAGRARGQGEYTTAPTGAGSGRPRHGRTDREASSMAAVRWEPGKVVRGEGTGAGTTRRRGSRAFTLAFLAPSLLVSWGVLVAP